MKAIRVHHHGNPEVLQVEEIPVPQPKSDEVLVKNQAIGVNFVDTQHRAGLNFPIQLPLIPGTEAAGILESVGSDVKDFQVGDRVGYAGYMGGNYAEYTMVPQNQLIPLPDKISFETAAAALLQGMTAHCLAQSVYPVQHNDRVLVHAAASGVGYFLVQMAKHRGATVLGTVSTEEKAEFVTSMGGDHVIRYTQTDFEAETMRLTQNQGVHVVYDAVGRTTFDKSLRVLRSKGYMVVYGLSSGPIPPFDINRLSGITGAGHPGSLFLTWATMSDYTREREDLLWRARELFQGIVDGMLKVHVAQKLPLINAAEAHRLLETRQVWGKILLLP